MPRRPATSLVAWLVLLVVLAASCAPTTPSAIPPEQPPTPVRAAEIAIAPQAPLQIAGSPGDADEGADAAEGGDPGPIPATRADPARGSRGAPVTLVLFSDFQCPFCQRLNGTLSALRRQYGPDRLRIVWKNNPLPFHKDARPAAEAAMALFAHQGPDAFWAFHDAIFESDQRLSPALQDEALRQVGVSPRSLEAMLASGAAADKVEADMALAKRLGATGTPASFINGVFLSGAQPLDKFREIIDAQLSAARDLRAQGVPPSQIYAALAAKNYAPREIPPRGSSAAAAPPKDDKTVHQVPVAGSPVRGKAAALVTLVMFSDFQCPFCGRVAPTVDQLSTEYGDKLRVVWKNNPLPFHARAEPAAELAMEARAQKGDAAFWKAYELLFASQRNLENADLERIAAALRLNVAAAKRAIAAKKHARKIEEDIDLADDLDARGTPHFFINGRRLVGAQPIEKFRGLIDEELAKAQALVAKGTPAARVYDTLQKQASPPPAPRKVTTPAVGKGNPARGAARGKVVIQMFADFQCPFCARAVPTLDEVLKDFPGKVRIVWRNMPLSMHPEAELAAEAAMEAFAQKGSAGFWKMHDLLLQDTSAQNLDRAALDRHAARIGLDMARFSAALETRAHRAAIDADKKAAQQASITGTPGFVINGYLLSGAQPAAKFRKVIRRALAEVK